MGSHRQIHVNPLPETRPVGIIDYDKEIHIKYQLADNKISGNFKNLFLNYYDNNKITIITKVIKSNKICFKINLFFLLLLSAGMFEMI